jgi:hypothetical protein
MTIDLERLAVDLDYWNEVAPEWATGYGNAGVVKVSVWFNKERYSHVNPSVHFRDFQFSENQGYSASQIQTVATRPTKPAASKPHPTDTQLAESGAQISAEWDGNIPPVGWHGECTWASKVFFPQCVILPNGKVVIEFYGLWEFRNISELDQIMFRPILSREQRDREEIISAAAKVVEVKFGSPRSVYIAYCEALYDAGMLKRTEK